jgi:DNA gyrase subunit A
VQHQRDVITRRSQYRLDDRKRKAHLNEGLLKALNMIDEIIAAIRASDDRSAAREALMATPFEFSEPQAERILDMTLGRLTRLARIDIETALEELRAEILELEAILADPLKRDQVIKDELAEIRDEFATDRRTSLEIDMGELDIEDLIDDEALVVTLSSTGYIKSVSAEEFRAQGRGGRGVTGAKLKDDDDDLIHHLLHTTAHAYLLFFTNRGKVYRIKAHTIPVSGRTSRGMALVNLLQLEADEKVQAIIDTRDYETNQYLFFATRHGRVKRTLMSAYDSSLKAGLRAINLNDGDELVSAVATNGVNDIFMVSRFGQALRFSQEDVRVMGRTAAGVRGMRFRAGDELVSMDLFQPGDELLVITDEGYGKRTDPDLFTRKGRGGLGVRCVRVNEKKGKVVGAMFVAPQDEILLISTAGVVIRTRASDISQQGRDATGVSVMSLSNGSRIAAVARMLGSEQSPAVDSEATDSDITESDVTDSDAVTDRADTDRADTDRADTDRADDG